LLFYAIPVGVILGWIRGGSLASLGEYPFRRMELLVFAFFVQIALVQGPSLGWTPDGRIAFLLHLVSYVLLGAMLFANLRAPGMPVVLLGVMANVTVIAANGGMPVDVDRLRALGYETSAALLLAGESATHRALTPATRFPYLGDVLLGPQWLPGTALLSPGDLVMMLGIAWVLAAGMTHGAEES